MKQILEIKGANEFEITPEIKKKLFDIIRLVL